MPEFKNCLPILLLSVICVTSEHTDLLKPCLMSDMECIRDTTQQFLEKTSNGIPQYGVKAIDPLKVEKLDYDLPEFGCSHHASNVVIVGLKQLHVSDFKMDTVNKMVTFNFNISVTAEGDISVDYYVKPKPKTVSGHYTSEFQILATTRYPYSVNKAADGVMHYEVGDEEATFVLQGIPRYNLSDEFVRAVSADPQLIEERKKVAGRKEEFIRVLGKQLVDVIVPTLVHNLRQAAKILPVTAFFKTE